MGILNITPDSFSDGGMFDSLDRALKHAEKLKRDGADILDIGGESTRPGFRAVSVEEELERVIPIIEKVSTRIDLPISIDTYKAQVAKEAIQAGAHIINDVWGAKKDADMPRVMGELQVPVILMHNRVDAAYQNLINEVIEDMESSITLVKDAGVSGKNIILDPGIGFAKTVEENIYVMQHLDELVALGYPVLLGTSRKSFIGYTLQLDVDQRLEGTLATVGWGITKGCHIIRVHDVQQTVRFCQMMDVLKGAVENG
ncbi:dihydropteroate synthase [Shimazuella sp. AN120528]|uniref:dihydropteroate synthase n=1 Tax=Shimazuella soli TaxID=1892854 RepID=UPI001F0E2280|nr:dihydropteroate synthase [Shimazuella soli]MCH5585879.1 dihydropteroate synthase [Shimazuella soli]